MDLAETLAFFAPDFAGSPEPAKGEDDDDLPDYDEEAATAAAAAAPYNSIANAWLDEEQEY